MVCDDGEKAVEFVKMTANANGHLTPLIPKDIFQQVRSRYGTGFSNPKLAADLLCTLEIYPNKSEEAAAMISTKYNSSQAVVETAQKAVDEAYTHVVLSGIGRRQNSIANQRTGKNGGRKTVERLEKSDAFLLRPLRGSVERGGGCCSCKVFGNTSEDNRRCSISGKKQDEQQ